MSRLAWTRIQHTLLGKKVINLSKLRLCTRIELVSPEELSAEETRESWNWNDWPFYITCRPAAIHVDIFLILFLFLGRLKKIKKIAHV